MGSSRTRWAVLAIALGTLGVPGVCAPPLGAQALGWSGMAEVSGNLFYGDARGRVASAPLRVGRADSALQVRADAQLTYADARDTRGGSPRSRRRR
jgi:hypothetical protein